MKKQFSIKSLLRNERGMALVIVLLVLTLFSVLGISIFSLALSNGKMSASDRTHESVYYIAEGGLAPALQKLDQVALDIKKETEKQEDGKNDEEEFFAAFESKIFSGSVTYPSPDFEEVYGEKPSAAIAVTKADSHTYRVRSTGEIGSESRIVEQTFKVNWTPAKKFTDFAVFADTISVGQGGDIEGNVGARSLLASSVTLKNGNPSISGSIYVPFGTENTAVTGTSQIPVPYEGKVSFKTPAFPVIPGNYDVHADINLSSQSSSHTLELAKNISIANIKLKKGTLTVNVGDKDREMVIDNLSSEGGTIDILGSGNLKIYIKNNLELTQSAKINFNGNEVSDIQKLTLYLAPSEGPKTLHIGSGVKIHGSFHAGNASLKFGSHSSFEGHVVTSGTSVSLDAASNIYNSLFYAPNADFKVTGSADMRGLIVANTFESTGGQIKMQPIDYSTVPFPIPIVGVLVPYEEGSLLRKKSIREID